MSGAGTGTGQGLPPNFRLNLTGIAKKTAEAVVGEEAEKAAPPPITKQPRGATVQPPSRTPAAAEPSRNATTLARKNLIVGSESSDDDDLDLEMIPVGKDEPDAKDDAAAEVIEAPSIQVSHLPDLVVDDDDEDMPGAGEGGKLSLLQDLLLTAELAEEPADEWTYRQFIKQFRNSEASQDGPEGEDEIDDYSMGGSSEDEDD
jgi:hypothetical protein